MFRRKGILRECFRARYVPINTRQWPHFKQSIAIRVMLPSQAELGRLAHYIVHRAGGTDAPAASSGVLPWPGLQQQTMMIWIFK